MKRVLLRIFALGIIVALGLLAIAQAQRVVRDRTAAEPEGVNTLRQPAGNSATPLALGEVGANPLRRQAGEMPVVEPLPPRPLAAEPRAIPSPPIARPREPVERASAEMELAANEPDPRRGANPLRNPAADVPLRKGPVDPFGQRANRDDSVRRAVGEEIDDTRFPRAASRLTGAETPVVDSPRDEARTRPANTRPSGDLPPLAPRDDRYDRRSAEREPLPLLETPSQEPGRLSADPSAAPANTMPPSPDAAGGDPAGSAASAGPEGAGQPGAKQLEGPQSPQLMIQKFAPPEIQVGRPAGFRVTVRNTGTVPAANAEIHDQVPKGTRLLGTSPRATCGPRGELVWALGTVKPGEEVSVEMQVMPTAEGEIGSVATVQFGAAATARSVSTRPRLVIETAGSSRVLLGDEAALTFTVSNPGTGVATGVVLEEHVPEGMLHPAGPQLEYPVGDLKPGESRRLELKLKSARPGTTANRIVARGDASLRVEHRFDLEVVAPKLDIALAGPKRRYLEREATYQLSVSNPGTAPAQQVELAAYLPPGMKFVGANNHGQFDEATRTVHWRLEELPVNVKGTVELVTLPIEPGQQSIKVRGSAQRGLSVEREQPVVVEGIAAVLFQVADRKDPIEVGGDTTYEIRVMNQGSKAAGNIRVSVVLPPELRPLAAEGPSRFVIDNNQVVFDGLGQLAPKTDVVYRVRAQGVRPGDLRVRCQLLTDDMQSPVIKEESTRVYADE